MYEGSPNHIATLVAVMLNNAAFDRGLTRYPEVNVIIRNPDGTITRDTVHV